LTDPQPLLGEAISGYWLAYLACGVMIARRLWQLGKWRRLKNGQTRSWVLWPLAFYWPVYIWGWEALGSVVFGPMAGCWSGAPGTGTGTTLSLLSAGAVYASAFAWVLVVSICAITQVLINRQLGIPSYSPAIPMPTLAVFLNVIFVNSSFVVVFASMR